MRDFVFPANAARFRNTSSGAGWQAGSRLSGRKGSWPANSTASAPARASPELVRLAGSLERLPRETKADLIHTFIAQVLQRVEAKQHCAPYLAALGLLLNRAPLYAGPETVVAAEFVARAYAAFQNFDWAEPELLELQSLFLRAARVVDDRNLDVPKSLRNQIARKLESAGIAPIRTATIKAFTPVGGADRTTLYGESLPPGLVLSATPD